MTDTTTALGGGTTRPDRELVGHVAVVTGAASGIGRASARALACAGADVALVDRDSDGGRAVAGELRELGVEARCWVVDLAVTTRVRGVVAEIAAVFPRVDVLVNAAGITGPYGGLLDLDEGTWDQVLGVNLRAPIVLMREVARRMAQDRGGRIVNVASSSAFRARSSSIAYATSKAALVHLTRCAAAELGPLGINVNAVAPGLTLTGMTADRDAADLEAAVTSGPLANLLQRVSLPEDVAAAVLFLCLPASRQITGQTIHTSAGAVV